MVHLEELVLQAPWGIDMTAKVQGLPARLGGVYERLNKAADAAVARLERAEGLNMAAVQKIHAVAGELEEHAKLTHEQLDDMLNRNTNGAPPLDDSIGSARSPAPPSDGGETRPLDEAAAQP